MAERLKLKNPHDPRVTRGDENGSDHGAIFIPEPNLFHQAQPASLIMFEPNEESIVLEMVRGFFDVPAEEMMKIGDLTKKLIFNPDVDSEEAAIEQFRSALNDMPKEHVLIAGMFISGLMRCNLAQQIQQQYEQEMAKCGQESDGGCGPD